MLIVEMKKPKVAVLVSGGVDSSVALAELVRQNKYDITAFYLKIWLEDELAYLGECPWQTDLSFIEPVVAKLGVPLQVVPLQNEYQESIVAYTVREIRAGRTPNPDILCNQLIKFGVFYTRLTDRYDFIATGHYARKGEIAGKSVLMQSPDPIKDQTYFLSYLRPEQLSRALFPIGHLTKQEVRQRAQEYGLAPAGRKDSQGLCFLGKIAFRDFVRHWAGEQEGELCEYETGDVLGTHQGYWFYTIGQRQGLGLSGGPWYVVGKDVAKNRVYISRRLPAKRGRDTVILTEGNWFVTPPRDQVVRVKLRHGPRFGRAQATLLAGERHMLKLSEPDAAIVPGQFAALYHPDEPICFGSGVIT